MEEQVLEFKKCPACRGTNRFFEQLASEAKKERVALFDFRMGLQSINGPCADQRIKQPPIGANIPVFQVITDICTDCGCVYATFLAEKSAHVSIPIATKIDKMILDRMPGQPRFN